MTAVKCSIRKGSTHSDVHTQRAHATYYTCWMHIYVNKCTQYSAVCVRVRARVCVRMRARVCVRLCVCVCGDIPIATL